MKVTSGRPHLIKLFLLSIICSTIDSFQLLPRKGLIPVRASGPRVVKSLLVRHERKKVAWMPRRLPSTTLFVLLEVPDHFFAITLFSAGIVLQFTKNFGRYRMEERAWEQRLEEGRQLRQERDPAMTELDYRRQEAAQEWSAYGKPRFEEERRRKQQEEWARQREQDGNSSRSRRRRVMVKDYDEEKEDQDGRRRQLEMTDDEIRTFELENGIEYDPYYDEPYAEDELPPGKFQTDKRYGDRIYENGEIFYKDAKSGLFYRQGSKPRNPSLW